MGRNGSKGGMTPGGGEGAVDHDVLVHLKGVRVGVRTEGDDVLAHLEAVQVEGRAVGDGHRGGALLMPWGQ